jgi:hypothetical protein
VARVACLLLEGRPLGGVFGAQPEAPPRPRDRTATRATQATAARLATAPVRLPDVESIGSAARPAHTARSNFLGYLPALGGRVWTASPLSRPDWSRARREPSSARGAASRSAASSPPLLSCNFGLCQPPRRDSELPPCRDFNLGEGVLSEPRDRVVQASRCRRCSPVAQLVAARNFAERRVAILDLLRVAVCNFFRFP